MCKTLQKGRARDPGSRGSPRAGWGGGGGAGGGAGFPAPPARAQPTEAGRPGLPAPRPPGSGPAPAPQPVRPAEGSGPPARPPARLGKGPQGETRPARREPGPAEGREPVALSGPAFQPWEGAPSPKVRAAGRAPLSSESGRNGPAVRSRGRGSCTWLLARGRAGENGRGRCPPTRVGQDSEFLLFLKFPFQLQEEWWALV